MSVTALKSRSERGKAARHSCFRFHRLSMNRKTYAACLPSCDKQAAAGRKSHGFSNNNTPYMLDRSLAALCCLLFNKHYQPIQSKFSPTDSANSLRSLLRRQHVQFFCLSRDKSPEQRPRSDQPGHPISLPFAFLESIKTGHVLNRYRSCQVSAKPHGKGESNMHRARIGSQRQFKVVAKIRQFGDRALLRQHFQAGHAD
jgi:hypothetical protein